MTEPDVLTEPDVHRAIYDLAQKAAVQEIARLRVRCQDEALLADRYWFATREIVRLTAENQRLQAVATAARDAVAEFQGEPVDELGLAVRLTRLLRALRALDTPGTAGS